MQWKNSSESRTKNDLKIPSPALIVLIRDKEPSSSDNKICHSPYVFRGSMCARCRIRSNVAQFLFDIPSKLPLSAAAVREYLCSVGFFIECSSISSPNQQRCATHAARQAVCQAGLVGLVVDNLIDIGHETVPGACLPPRAGGCRPVHRPHLISRACRSSSFWQSGWLSLTVPVGTSSRWRARP